MDDLRRFEPYARWLAHRFRLHGRAAGDEEDVMQEAMIAAWQAMRIYRPRRSGSELGPFVKQLMKFRVIQYVRLRSPDGQRRADREALPLEAWDARGGDATFENVLARERLRIAAEAIRALPRWQRDRLLGYMNGVPRKEMGSVGAGDQALHRARRRVGLALGL